jgi:hypothetical protein
MTDTNRPLVTWDLPATPATSPEATSTPPGQSVPRPIAMIGWIVGIGMLYLLADIAVIAGRSSGADPSRSAAYTQGLVIGYVLGSLAFAAVARWLYVRVKQLRRRVISPWLIAIAALVLLANVASSASRPIGSSSPATGSAPGAVPTADPVADRLRIRLPYDLAEADAEARQALLQPLTKVGAAFGYRGGDVKSVIDKDDVVGYLVVLHLAINGQAGEAAYLDGFLKSAARSGATVRQEGIAGHTVGVADGPTGTIMTWIESPLIVMVVGFDGDSAESIARATMPFSR